MVGCGLDGASGGVWVGRGHPVPCCALQCPDALLVLAPGHASSCPEPILLTVSSHQLFC